MASREQEKQMRETHLCGGYAGQDWCDGFYENGDTYATVTKRNGTMKMLQPFCLYCKHEGYRKIASKSSWTGISPKWCPKRQEAEE